MSNGEVILLENLRFHPEEEQNDDEFAHALAQLGDIYINDAFGAAHQPHAFNGWNHPSYRGVSNRIFNEVGIRIFRNLLVDPAKPFAAILGGAESVR